MTAGTLHTFDLVSYPGVAKTLLAFHHKNHYYPLSNTTPRKYRKRDTLCSRYQIENCQARTIRLSRFALIRFTTNVYSRCLPSNGRACNLSSFQKVYCIEAKWSAMRTPKNFSIQEIQREPLRIIYVEASMRTV